MPIESRIPFAWRLCQSEAHNRLWHSPLGRPSGIISCCKPSASTPVRPIRSSGCSESIQPIGRPRLKSLHDAVALQDFHVHTHLSPCAKDPAWTPEAIARRAEEIGMRTVVLADHYYERRPGFDPPPFYAEVNEDCFERTARAVAALDTDVEMLVSCEIDMVRPGLFTLSEEFASRLPVGLVSASHYHLEGIEQPQAQDARGLGRYLVDRMRAAIEWPPTQILAHPLSALQGSLGDLGKVLDAIADEEFAEVLALARERDVAIELRASVFGEDKEHHGRHMRFYGLARSAGCKIAPVSDAHSAEKFGSTFDLVPWVERLGFGAEDVIDSDWLRVCSCRG